MNLIKSLKVVHRYFAFAGLVVFVALGVTGAVLAFRADLEQMLHPERQIGTPTAGGVRYQRLLEVARQTAPNAEAWRINPPADPTRAVQVLAEGPDEVLMFLHPSDGTVLSVGAVHAYPVDLILELHIELLAGPGGQLVVFVAGIGLIGLVITGIVLWWPRSWRAAFRYRLSNPPPLFHLELHRLVGILLGLPLGAVAITGALLVYPEKSMQLVRWLSGEPAKLRAKNPGEVPASIDLDRIVQAAQNAFPDGRVTRVTVPANGAPVIVRKKVDGENHPNGLNLIIVEPTRATVLSAVPAVRAHPAIKMWEWIYPLHIGTLFGPVNKMILILTGILPLVMAVTGTLLWWHRRRARARRGVTATPHPSQAHD